MAKRGRKPKSDQGPRVIKTTAEEFQKAVSEASRHKDSAKTYTGYHGEAVKRFCERSGFSPKAFRIVQTFHAVPDEFKRDDLIREVLMGIELMGYGKQGDLFDDVQKRVKALNDQEWEDAAPKDGGASESLSLDEAEKAFEKNAGKARKSKSAVAEGLGDAPSSYTAH